MIEPADYNIIKNAFYFSERTARQIMVSRTQVSAIDINNFNDEVLEKVIEENKLLTAVEKLVPFNKPANKIA